MLLAHDADINARMTVNPPKNGTYDYKYMSLVGATPFFLAVKAADTTLMGLLLDHGADPSIPNTDGTMPLLVAAGIGYIEGQILTSEARAFDAVLMLVELGEDVNSANGVSQTALHGAAMMGSNLILQYLLDLGADINARNTLGWTPLMVAEGVFVANTEKAWPDTVALLRELGARAGPRQ